MKTTSKFFRYIFLSSGLLLLGACASPVPNVIRQAPAPDIRLREVQSSPEKFIGKAIRWGGHIISTNNLPGSTELIILASPLDSEGEPLAGDQSYGRFIVEQKTFLDPAIYATGRGITIYGEIDSVSERKVDRYLYRYPIVKATHLYLWEKSVRHDYDHYPYWYDPWYPYGGPYYHRPHRHY